MSTIPDGATPCNLPKILARASAATPGPWIVNGYSTVSAPHKVEAYRAATTEWDIYAADPEIASVPAFAGDTASGPRMADAAFIAAARTDVPALVAEVERLSGDNERLIEQCSALAGAIAELAKKAGIYNGDAGVTGPRLIMLCENVAEEVERLRAVESGTKG